MRIDFRPAGGAVRAVLARTGIDHVAWREHVGVAALIVVMVAAGWLRLSGANWDQGAHLHPDERYIASLANVLHFPGSLGSYLDVRRSSLSPYNAEGGRSYSYGTLPLFATKAVADVVGQGDYDHLYLVGRRLSALLDIATILLVFLITRTLLAGRSRPRRAFQGGLLAAALYALTVAAVQASHFFTTDTWLVFFGTLTFYLAVRSLRPAGRVDWQVIVLVALVGLGMGFTVACKASGLFVAIPVVIALLGRAAIAAPRLRLPGAALHVLSDGLVVLVSAYLGFRLVSPYSFAHSSWLDLTIGADYRHALQEQRNILDGKAIFPPTLQWLLSPRLWDPFRNLVTWQLGIPLGVCAIGGTGLLAGQVARPLAAVARTRAWRRSSLLSAEALIGLTARVMLLAFVGSVFFYVATRFQHMGRYLLPILPLLAVAAAYALAVLFDRRERLFASFAVLVLALTGAYALAFHAIYSTRTTRLAANDWIAEHVLPGSTIADENWDDTLPVGGLAASYKLIIVPVFDADDGSKLRKLYAGLSTADYYALSSPRAWRTIGRLPDRYPLMVRFYRQLFAGRLGFEPAMSFSSQPRLLGVHVDDLSAEEAFWVYDHPPVRIFRHTARLTFAEFRGVLCTPPSPSACS